MQKKPAAYISYILKDILKMYFYLYTPKEALCKFIFYAKKTCCIFFLSCREDLLQIYFYIRKSLLQYAKSAIAFFSPRTKSLQQINFTCKKAFYMQKVPLRFYSNIQQSPSAYFLNKQNDALPHRNVNRNEMDAIGMDIIVNGGRT